MVACKAWGGGGAGWWRMLVQMVGVMFEETS